MNSFLGRDGLSWKQLWDVSIHCCYHSFALLNFSICYPLPAFRASGAIWLGTCFTIHLILSLQRNHSRTCWNTLLSRWRKKKREGRREEGRGERGGEERKEIFFLLDSFFILFCAFFHNYLGYILFLKRCCTSEISPNPCPAQVDHDSRLETSASSPGKGPGESPGLPLQLSIQSPPGFASLIIFNLDYYRCCYYYY